MHMHDTTELPPPPFPFHADYRGVNHARMTEAMETRLRDMPVAFLVLSRLRRLVGDGNTITLYGGVRGWAIWMDCSPGYPKAILNRLAHEGFITVIYLDDGFAEVRVLPPAELGDRHPPTDHWVIGSDDPAPRPRGRAVPPQSRTRTRSISDRMSHESESDQLANEPLSHEKTNADPAAAPPPADLSPAQQAVLDGLRARQIYPALAQQILRQHPRLTLADFDLQVARLTARGTYAQPVFVAAKILARGDTVAAPEPARPTAAPRKPRDSDAIRLAGHITEAERTHWLDLCARYPADIAEVVQAFWQQHPLPNDVEVA
jgi:hypothetical protein